MAETTAETSTTEAQQSTGASAETTGSTETESETEKSQKKAASETAYALRKANKEAETLRLKLKEIEDRDKSEAQRLADRVAEAERRAVTAEKAALRFKVGTAKGLAPELAERLVGDTEDDMAADADRLLAVLKPRQSQTGSFEAGAKQSAPAGADMNAMIRRAAGRA